MRFERAQAIADAVLHEGYVLYPYRASSAKNRYRWAFGVLAPRAWSDAGGCEPWWMETECLVEPGPAAAVSGRLRFLHQVERRIEAATDPAAATFVPVDSLETGEHLLVPWEEGHTRAIDFDVELAHLQGSGEVSIPFEVAGGSDVHPATDADGTVIGRVTRRWSPVRGRIRVRSETVATEPSLVRLSVHVANLTPWASPQADRRQALSAACIGTHLLLAATDAAFVSLLDPPPRARAAAAACTNTRAYPVLAGPPGDRDLVLAAPIILYDHPRLAPESPGDFFDATEIDEMLTLRTRTLTDEEKRHARATDERAAAIIDRVDALPPAAIERLHGAIRDFDGPEMVPRASEPRRSYAPGAKVRLRPGARRTDAQDLLFAGCVATVEEIRHDVDGRSYVAVTIDDDPASELHRWYGRYFYYELDEVEPAEEETR
jgi:hypothetical protein